MLSAICKIVRETGKMLTSPEAEAARHAPQIKGARNDFVTACDRAVQKQLFAILGNTFPHAKFLGEEDDAHITDFSGDVFVIDPIDGTTNFVRDLHASSISVGLLRNGEPYLGVIYNPYLDELYSAEKDKGAYLNGRRLTASTATLRDSLLLFGSAPYYRDELGEATVAVLGEAFNRCLDVRRSGSAAIDFANLAAGRADAFFELRLQPWDYAAGITLITEAGGVICQPDGSPLRFDKPCAVVAGSTKAVAELREIICR